MSHHFERLLFSYVNPNSLRLVYIGAPCVSGWLKFLHVSDEIDKSVSSMWNPTLRRTCFFLLHFSVFVKTPPFPVFFPVITQHTVRPSEMGRNASISLAFFLFYLAEILTQETTKSIFLARRRPSAERKTIIKAMGALHLFFFHPKNEWNSWPALKKSFRISKRPLHL